MNRCLMYSLRLWPWQSQGHLVQADGSWMRWHGSCWLAARRDNANVITRQWIRVQAVRASIDSR